MVVLETVSILCWGTTVMKDYQSIILLALNLREQGNGGLEGKQLLLYYFSVKGT